MIAAHSSRAGGGWGWLGVAGWGVQDDGTPIGEEVLAPAGRQTEGGTRL